MNYSIQRELVLNNLRSRKDHPTAAEVYKSVKEACFLSGFKDYANFLRTFKKYEGYTPGEFDTDDIENL